MFQQLPLIIILVIIILHLIYVAASLLFGHFSMTNSNAFNTCPSLIGDSGRKLPKTFTWFLTFSQFPFLVLSRTNFLPTSSAEVLWIQTNSLGQQRNCLDLKSSAT